MDKELEEAIEILHKVQDFLKFYKGHGWIPAINNKDVDNSDKAIDTVLQALEEYQKQLDLDYVDKNYIPKKKVEDKLIKLKEYKTKLEKELINAEMGTNILAIEEDISKIESQINLLQELLEDK